MKSAWLFALLPPVAVLLLTQFVAFQQSPLSGEWLYPLLVANVVLICLMSVVVLIGAVRFWNRWRRGAAGSRLASRLAGLFLVMALLPAAVVYAVSAGSIFRGIESWFSTPLGRAFEEGMSFGQHVISQELSKLERDARDVAWAVEEGRSLSFWSGNLRFAYQVDRIIIYDKDGIPLGGDLGAARPLDAPVLKSLERKRPHKAVSEGAVRHLEVTMLLPSSRAGYAIRVERALSQEVATGLREVERGREAYHNLLIVRRGLLYSFMATLTLSFVIVLALSLWGSMLLGVQFLRPLALMSTAAAEVGRGNFSRRLQIGERNDEISQVAQAFNKMVDDLRQTRRDISERQAQLSESNAYLENMLASLTTGVLAADAAGKLARFNAAALELLDAPLAENSGVHFSKWQGMPELSSVVGEVMSETGGQSECQVPRADGRMLIVRARKLPLAAGGGALVVVDDISRQIAAERAAVWEEASRRFAHEIKNPLTPVQLAAERLETKLSGKLESEDQQTLSKLSLTIINQVDAMRQMVDSFRLYADSKSRRKTPVDLSATAAEVAQLYERPLLTLRTELAKDLPPINGDAVLLRQAMHNLMLNASDAVGLTEMPEIIVRTMRNGSRGAFLTVEDNGTGIPEDMLEKMFMPYQTSKSRGTGLGLAIVRKVMEEHGGEAKLENTGNGARAILSFPLP